MAASKGQFGSMKKYTGNLKGGAGPKLGPKAAKSALGSTKKVKGGK